LLFHHSRFRLRWLGALWLAVFCLQLVAAAESLPLNLAPKKSEAAIRVATFNVSLNRPEAGALTKDLTGSSDAQILAVASIIRSVQPDILLLNEIDYSTEADNAALFQEKFLADPATDLLGGGPWKMPFHFAAPVNTGVPSGLDLNRNGRTEDPEDAWGYGQFAGQYGMAVLSRFEIDLEGTRTFQQLLWSDLPGALEPTFPKTGEKYYPQEIWSSLRLPSKSLWDVQIRIPGGPLHFIVSHPTPPAFDGPEDRNGCRNHDEIRLLTSYIDGRQVPPASQSREEFWMDDSGRSGALAQDALFVIAGDLNCDPMDGDSRRDALLDLLRHHRVVATPVPASRGAMQASRQQGGKNNEHRGDSAHDTADFSDAAVGNLRVDYVLPSTGLSVIDCGVVWPEIPDSPSSSAGLLKQLSAASDHHLVWVDLQVIEREDAAAAASGQSP
jgi:hypothetical protein